MKFIAENKKLAVVLGSIIGVLCIAGVVAIVCISHAKNEDANSIAGIYDDFADEDNTDSEDDFEIFNASANYREAQEDDEDFEPRKPMTPEEQEALAKEFREKIKIGSHEEIVIKPNPVDDEPTKADESISPEQIESPTEVAEDERQDIPTDDDIFAPQFTSTMITYEEYIVLCDTFSNIEAESVAEQISGKLLSWDNGTAEIQISEPVDTLLERIGKNGNLPELYRKYIISK